MAGIWGRGDPYERYVGRWSRRVAPLFLDWLGAGTGLDWVDVGCGTGALTEAILDGRAPASVVGVDPAPGFVASARERLGGRARFDVGDAAALPLPDGCADAVVSGLVLNFVPDPAAAAAEALRIARPGAVVGAYVWDYAGRMDLMRRFWDAAAALDPEAARIDEGPRFPLAHPDALAALLTSAGCADVATTAVDIPTVFADFEDYWTPFLGGQGPAPAYTMSLEPEAREALRARLEETLPREADGSIALLARAWAVRGTRPGSWTAPRLADADIA
ncbi:class I SAM-dependent methyltransferase [Leifsonia shinshuensis]|uniref:class I SAM-dependent methyltransferase n=1 Tax=Leifsonia shinshuensis TaxID=150026 RepID=UPI001CA47B7F|nr:class I SAM-dependent methyltransferase [Leifsonia shinshuensis]